MHVCDAGGGPATGWRCDDEEVQRRWCVALKIGTAWGCDAWDRQPGKVWPEWPDARLRSLSEAKLLRHLGRHPRVREPAIFERLARCVGVSAGNAYRRCGEGDDPRHRYEFATHVVDGRIVRYYRVVAPTELAERARDALGGFATTRGC